MGFGFRALSIAPYARSSYGRRFAASRGEMGGAWLRDDKAKDQLVGEPRDQAAAGTREGNRDNPWGQKQKKMNPSRNPRNLNPKAPENDMNPGPTVGGFTAEGLRWSKAFFRGL